MIVGIHHTAISVPDMDKALGFYCDVLGFEKVSDTSWKKGSSFVDKIVGLKDSSGRGVMLRAQNAHIELFEYKTPAPALQNPDEPVNNHGITHFCLQVTNIQDEYERLQDAGMRFHCPPEDMGGSISTYGRDPFGNVIEVYEISDPAIPQL